LTNNFPKYQRLCGQLHIAQLYKDGRKFVAWPLRVSFMPADETQVLVWAPKSLFKHATDRNRLRRQMREAWRLNKAQLQKPYKLAFNYIDKEQKPYAIIERAFVKAIRKLNEETDS